MIIRSVAVLGAGTMGHGIAQLAAVAGHDVALYDLDAAFLTGALAKIEGSLARLKGRGALDAATVKQALARLHTTTDLAAAVRDADLVIEAVPERIEVKSEALRAVDAAAPLHAIIASNTSTIPISELAAFTTRPEQVVGVHFFNPPQLMPLVEVTRGEQTSEETLALVVGFARTLGKETVVCLKDLPGFIVNRVLGALLNEAGWLLQRGEATVRQVDSASRYRLGLPMGPFELADYIGLDVLVSVLELLAERGALAGVPPLWREMLAKGQLGAKSGRGFYEWSQRPHVPDGAGEDVDVVRLLAPAINSAATIVSLGATTQAEVDKAVRLGLGFPRGMLAWAQELGLAAVIDALTRLDARYGAWYRPDILLVEAAAGRKPLEVSKGEA